ncbi:MAG: hypothetical protein CM15mV3_2470 [Caudoviricetes sp.]|nr:MAG: hypothetical protein CM15mV3_2470 [Caudoviricetes sp.]
MLVVKKDCLRVVEEVLEEEAVPINITPGKGGPGMGGPSGGGLLKAGDTIQTAAKLGSNVKGISGAADLVGDVAGSGARSLARAGVKGSFNSIKNASNFVKNILVVCHQKLLLKQV